MNDTLAPCKPPASPGSFCGSPPAEAGLVDQLRASGLIRPRDWEKLSDDLRKALQREVNRGMVLATLVKHRLLTSYQAERISAGTTFGLILGNYRVLERIGAGSMGTVFKAEHLRLPRTVAIKVLTLYRDDDPEVLQRFLSEMWTVAQLRHNNIVGAIDAGEAPNAEPTWPSLHYYVMDYVAGENLEDRVAKHGPLSLTMACDVAHQVAEALAEAHKHGLVHRDIKPSNVLITAEGQAKLLDFGLARRFDARLAERGRVVGTLAYMAPEQIENAGCVDIRADIYGLGGVLCWCLTGHAPFELSEDLAANLAARRQQPPPSVRAWQPDLPAEIDAVLGQMMALKPEARFASPEAVKRALVPFLKPDGFDVAAAAPGQDLLPGSFSGQEGAPRAHRVLIVDDEPDIRTICKLGLQTSGVICHEAPHGLAALELARAKRYDLVLSDIDMPVMNGAELLRSLKTAPPVPHLKVIMFSGRVSGDEMAQMLAAGADDYLTKPLSLVQLLSRVKAALRLKEAQDRSDLLNNHLLTVNANLEQHLTARDSDLVQARNALVLALAELVSHRDVENGSHLARLQQYCRCLAEELAANPVFATQVDSNFIQMLVCSSPLHDIGKVGLPDHILLKPGKLSVDERLIMQTHTTIGASTLEKVASKHGFAVAFLQMAIDIARHHHERFDGRGYPDRLAGDAIPLAARIVAICDVYDALRSRRPYKPALSHATALQMITESSPGQFDPHLLQAFRRVAPEFERIAQETSD